MTFTPPLAHPPWCRRPESPKKLPGAGDPVGSEAALAVHNPPVTDGWYRGCRPCAHPGGLPPQPPEPRGRGATRPYDTLWFPRFHAEPGLWLALPAEPGLRGASHDPSTLTAGSVRNQCNGKNTSGTGEGIRVALALLPGCALLMLPLWVGAARTRSVSPASGHHFARQPGRGNGWLMDGGHEWASVAPPSSSIPRSPYYVSPLPKTGAHPQQAIYPLLGSATWPCCSPGVCLSVAACHHAPGRAPAASLPHLALPHHVAMDL